MSTPLWGPPAGGNSFGGATSGGFNSPWGPAPSEPSAQPRVGQSRPDSGATPGTFDVNPLNPAGSGEEVVTESANFLEGLKNTLFGVSTPDSEGKHGGFIGDIPGVGDVARAGSEAIANVGGAVASIPGHAADLVGGTLEHIPNPLVDQAALKARFDALPDTFQAKADAQAKIAADPGAAGHFMSEVLAAAEAEKDITKPNLDSGLFREPASVAETVSNIFGVLGWGQRRVERLIAGAAKPGSLDMNQLQVIQAVSRGEAEFKVGEAELSIIEQIAVAKTNDGTWTDDEALDFLASHGAGLSHDQLTQIAGTFATDPLNVASLGATALAKVGLTGAELVANSSKARAALAALESSGIAGPEEIAAARTAVELAERTTIAKPGAARGMNLLGKAAETERGTDFIRLISKPYTAMQGTAIGKGAKAIRYIVDPLHALGPNPRIPGTSPEVDLMSDVVSRQLAEAYGPIGHLQLLETLDSVSPTVRNQFVQDFAVYGANLTRRVVGNQHRASIMAAGFAGAEGLVNTLPDDIISGLMKGRPKSFLNLITEEAQRFRIRTWDDAALENLATRMETFYGVNDAATWRASFAKMNPDQLSMLHAASYGRATQQLINAVNVAVREGSGMQDKLRRLVLLNRDTLTTLGADGIIERIRGATTMDEAIEELKTAQTQYPGLRYFTFEPARPQASIDRFVAMLEAKKPHLPMQVTDDEVSTLHADLATLSEDIRGSYTLGFRPEDEFLWGLDRMNVSEGGFTPVGDVWAGHVGVDEAGPGFQAAKFLDFNFAGKPIVGHAARLARKPVDYMEAMGRVMKTSVSGSLIVDAAQNKFTALGVSRHGMTEAETKDIFERLQELTGATSTVANPRGLAPSNMWTAAMPLVPKRLIGKFTQRDLLTMVLDAYEGDVRFVGATQKLTGRAKALFGKTGINFLGEVSEHLYPLIKYRLNVIFQTQERIEPWVLNSQRGAQVALGTTLSPEDLVMQRNLENSVQHSLVRIADVDQFEYSLGVLHAANMGGTAGATGSRLGRIRNIGRQLIDVQGSKRINMLRTFRKGLGRELKGVWEQHSPGLWDEMKADAQLRARHLIDDDEFAAQVVAEQMLGNDVVVQRVINGTGGVDFKADFKAAIAPGAWSMPANLGELKPLELDTMSQLLGFTSKNGKAIKGSADLRAAIAAGELDIDDVADALFRHGADPDYVRRVENALSFSWEGFWKTAAERYHLGDDEVRALEDMFAGAASLRQMTPVDYISQVFSPTILGGTEAAVGDLGKAVEVLRAGKTVEEASLATLRAPTKGGEFIGTRDDLVRQLSSVFAAHLDPSAKRALLMEFVPELRADVLAGKSNMDLADIERMWQAQGDDALAQTIIDGMNATEGDIWEAALPRSAQEYNAKWPIKPVAIKGESGKRMRVSKVIGTKLAQADPELRDPIVDSLARMQAQFPDIPFTHVDIKPWDYIQAMDDEAGPGTIALTMGTNKDRGAILLSEDYFGPNYKQVWGDFQARHADHPNRTILPDGSPRVSDFGAPIQVNDTPVGTIYHEFGHLVQEYMDALSPTGGPSATASSENIKRFSEFNQFARDFFDSPAAFQLSEYATEAKHEAMAELFALAFDPEADLTRWPTVPPVDVNMAEEVGPATVHEAVDELKRILRDNGMWKEPPAPSPNPDVLRVHRQFGAWSAAAVNQGLLRGKQSRFSAILGDVAGIPTDGAAAYNLTEARLVQAAQDAMGRKWQDAFRLQYFAQNRTMLERSINHPMFGIYPASYMWGKILPEMLRFIATSPFGLETGAMAYSLANIQRAVNVQREFDPDFDKLVEDIGHSQALWFLGYLLPAVPWDVSAAMPTWMRDLSQQGLDNQSAVSNGGTVTAPDLYSAAQKQAEVINPIRGLKQLHSAGAELDALLNEPAEPAEDGAAATPGTAPNLGPVQGTELAPTLTESLRELQDALSS